MSAILDSTRTYRYLLTRPPSSFAKDPAPPVLWVALNPSTADETSDDATIRKCMAFQRLWGMGARGRLLIVNLFALRSTDPRALARHDDPIGPDNDDYIRRTADEVIASGGRVVAAWGAHPFARDRARRVREILWALDIQSLGTTKDGSPRHPLYVPYSQPLVPWEGHR